MTELSEAFYITLVATFSAMFGLTLRMCLRSRCDQVECGCIKIHRQTDLESQEQTQQQELGRQVSSVSEKINI